jgi:hypothetical protein
MTASEQAQEIGSLLGHDAVVALRFWTFCSDMEKSSDPRAREFLKGLDQVYRVLKLIKTE